MTKNLTLLLTAFALVFTASHAQAQYSRLKYNNKNERKSSWVQLTPLLSAGTVDLQSRKNIVGPITYSIKGISSRAAGALVDLNSHKAGIALQAGVLYSVEEYETSTSASSGGTAITSIDQRTDTRILLPFSAKFYPFTLAGKWLYLKGGINLAYLLSSQSEVGYTEGRNFILQQSNGAAALAAQEGGFDRLEDSNRFDVQATAGLGLNIPFSKKMGLTLEINYHHGFLDRIKDDRGTGIEEKVFGVSGLLGLAISL